MKYLLLLLVLGGCVEIYRAAPTAKAKENDWVYMEAQLFRYENHEAICYRHNYHSSISCMKKEKP